MNGSIESCDLSPTLQSSDAVASAPDLSSVVAAASTAAAPPSQSQAPISQQTPLISISRPSVIVAIPTQSSIVSNPAGSSIVFAAAPAAPNGSIVVPSSTLTVNTPLPISSSTQPLTLANGTVVTVMENTPKPTNSLMTTPSTIIPASSTPVVQSTTTTIQPTGRDRPQQKQIPVFKSKSLQEIVKETDPYLQLDEDAEELITLMAEEFVEHVAKKSIKLANHRGSSVVEARDVKHILEHHWDVTVPGFPTSEKNIKRPFITQAHKQHLAFLQRQVKRS